MTDLLPVRALRAVCAAVAALTFVAAGSVSLAGRQVPGQAAASPELLLDQGKRLFDAFQYDQAVPLLNQVVAQLTANGQVQRPDLLVQAYELRARARFALGDSLGTEQDFSALLNINPSFKLDPKVSPRVAAVFAEVRKVSVGQIALSLTPAGSLDIDGHTIAATTDAQTIDLPAGDHVVSASRPGYRPLQQKFSVAAGTEAPMALVLERVSSTLAVVTAPEDVEVILDGTTRGRTARGTGAEGSAPLVLTDLQPGSHRLQLRRDCYAAVDRTITIDQPGDLQTGVVKLPQTVASVKLETVETGATVLVDGAPRGTAPAELTVCAGPHVIEVRGGAGRFVDRRDWNAGDAVTLSATLRSAFPIVVAKGGSTVTADQVRANAERALAAAKKVLVYAPVPGELEAALRNETLPADWLIGDPNAGDTAMAHVPEEVTRDLGKRIAGKLQAQGIAVASAGTDPYTFSISLLAAGSGEADVMTIGTADAASRTRALDALDAPLPPLVRPSIETSVVDISGIKGAVVVRPGGSGAKAGLTLNDVIVGAGGQPVASVADLAARIAAVRPPAVDLALDVRKASGETRKVTVGIVMTPDTLPSRDPSLLYNRLLLDLHSVLKTSTSPAEQSAAHLNLAVVHMRLGDWDDALTELQAARLPDGPGVSAGTVAYLTGLCQDAVGRGNDAQAAFTRAAASSQARLWFEGPLVAPLAQLKLRAGR